MVHAQIKRIKPNRKVMTVIFSGDMVEISVFQELVPVTIPDKKIDCQQGHFVIKKQSLPLIHEASEDEEGTCTSNGKEDTNG